SFEFAANAVVGLRNLARRTIDQVEDDVATLGMAEKAVAQPDAAMRTFDQAWQVREHEVALVDTHDAKLRLQRGEGIVRDFRPGSGNAGEKRRLARIWHADQACVRDQFQFEDDDFLFARLSGIGMSRCLIGRALEMGIAEAAVAATQELQALSSQ